MLKFKATLTFIAQAPCRFFSLSFIIILFIIIIVIGNSLFNSACQELKNQIELFLPGSLLIKKYVPESEEPGFTESTYTATQILPHSKQIMDYTEAQPAVKAVLAFKLAQIQLEYNNHSIHDLYIVCLQADAATHLKPHLLIEQGDFLPSDSRGIIVSRALITRLNHTFNARFKVGDKLTLSNPQSGLCFSRYKLPIQAVYSLRQQKSEFDFISSLIVIDETSFNILCNLPLTQNKTAMSGENLVISDSGTIFRNHGSLFVRPDLSANGHSLTSLFTLLGDPKQKIVSLQPEEKVWQGLLISTSESSPQVISALRKNLAGFLKLQNIPTLVTDRPWKNTGICKRLELKHAGFTVIMVVFALLIIAGANLLLRPAYRESSFFSTTGACNSPIALIGLFFGRAVLQGILSGLVGILAAVIILKYFWSGTVYFSRYSLFHLLFDSQKLHSTPDLSAFLYVLLFLLFYSCFSWVYPVIKARK
ncbi:MAG: hypothetical protein JW822_11265 [Spirochaetales bacterium]|nr:hypothetical protein [Spirochaetales bacterium]